MRIKIFILALVALALYLITYKSPVYTLAEFEQKQQFKHRFSEFELALNKKFTIDSVIDGQAGLLRKLKDYEDSAAIQESSRVEFFELMNARFIKPNERNFEQSSLAPKMHDSDFKLFENIFYAEGLKYRLDSNVVVGLKLENPLAWLSKDESDDSLWAASSPKNESKVLFTFSYSF